MSAFCRNQYYTVQSGMKNSFRLDNIQNILTPVPPLGEQIRIAKKLSSIWLHIQQIDDESETAADIISKAKSKILNLAIRGQLVPQASVQRKKNSSSRAKSSETRRNPSSSVVRITLIMRRLRLKSGALIANCRLIYLIHGHL